MNLVKSLYTTEYRLGSPSLLYDESTEESPAVPALLLPVWPSKELNK